MPTQRSRGSSNTSAKPRRSGLVTGAAGRKRIASENKKVQQKAAVRQAQYDAPRRFWMPPGSEREVIILDVEPWAFRYEHALDNPESGRKDLYVACLKETEDCPACHADSGREGAWVLYLTVIDLESFVTKKNKKVPYTQKLFVVKTRQQGKFQRKFDATSHVRGLRGLKVKLFRDDDRSPVIGNDIEFTGKRVSEEALAKYIEKYTDRKGKAHVKKLGEVLDYEKLFPAVTKTELEAQCGHKVVTPGSDEEANETGAAGSDWDKNPDDTPWEETKKPVRRKKKVVKKRKTAGTAPRRTRRTAA